MSRFQLWVATGRRLTATDVVVVAWVIGWLLLGFTVAREVRGLTELSGTVRTVGGAVEESGAALQRLGDVPVVGGGLSDAVAEPSQRIQEAGRTVQSSGESSRESIDDLSALLGLAIALIPTVPVLAFYVPLRRSRWAEARALERARERAGDDRRFTEFLARRAVNHLPYRALFEASSDPWGDLSPGDGDRLAAAELRRVGVSSRRSGRRQDG